MSGSLGKSSSFLLSCISIIVSHILIHKIVHNDIPGGSQRNSCFVNWHLFLVSSQSALGGPNVDL